MFLRTPELGSVDPVTSHNITSHLRPDASLANGIRSSSKKSSSSHQPSVKEYISLLCNEDNTTPAGAASAFMAPMNTGGGGSGRVTIEFDVIGRRLKMRVFESNVRERFGDDAVKVIRILVDKGKMDEKHVRILCRLFIQRRDSYPPHHSQLAKIALMAPNALRPILTQLSSASLVSLQEVPKSADRNPSRTFYLWCVCITPSRKTRADIYFQGTSTSPKRIPTCFQPCIKPSPTSLHEIVTNKRK